MHLQLEIDARERELLLAALDFVSQAIAFERRRPYVEKTSTLDALQRLKSKIEALRA
ncbi:MAG: hypothetical protein ACYDDF_15295 [Thermoplasmatota archaeon]